MGDSGGRTFGILLHPSSLPGRDDVGTFGRAAYRFVDWLAACGAGTWQILPLTPNGQYDSPYFSYSAFATNPWLIDLELLREAGLVVPRLNDDVSDARVPFAELATVKLPQLVTAAHAFLGTPDHPWRPAFDRFRATQPWLADTALFRALADSRDGAPWWEWPAPLRTREPAAVAASAAELAAQVATWEALFFFGDLQWSELKAYANGAGLQVLGDLPIYVTHDSADVWIHQDLFQLDADGGLLAQSGVPPDYFSATGQLWGNPLYRWDRMAEDGYAWWVARLRRCLEQADVVRIDHFRALAAYWRVPADAPDARAGEWADGPGQQFMDTLAREFPAMPFVAEDLGTLDDAVYRLRDDNHLPGMRILQFGFDGTPDNPHLPHAFPEGVLVYTGTHDNEPIAAWWQGLDEATRTQVAEYYQVRATDDLGHVVWALVEAAFGSRARTAVFPVQDLLVLDERARMNDPSVFVDNWSWRMPPDGTSPELAGSLHRLAEVYGRLRV